MGKWDRYKKKKKELTEEEQIEKNKKANINCLITVFPILLKNSIK